MKILFDHNMNYRLRSHLSGHEIRTAAQMGWQELENGELLGAAASQGFNALLTVDKNMEHEQNLGNLQLPIIVLDAQSNRLEGLMPFVPPLMELLGMPLDRILYILQLDGTILRLTAPRS